MDSDWSFENLDLNQYKSFSFNDDNLLNNFYFQTGLAYLTEKSYSDAYLIFKEFAASNEENDYAQNLAGIVSFILSNYLDAQLYVRKAIEINPTNDSYYFNLFYLNLADNNPDEALKNISTAIQLNPDQPEYYSFRASLFMDRSDWEKAISDLNKCIIPDRVVSSYQYLQRGIAKLHIQDHSACNDLLKAYNLSTNDAEKVTITNWYNQYCR